MPDNVVHESMRLGIFFFFLVRGDTSCLPQDERDGITTTSGDLGKCTTLNPGNRLLITWVNMAYKIEDRYLPSTHFWDSGPW